MRSGTFIAVILGLLLVWSCGIAGAADASSPAVKRATAAKKPAAPDANMDVVYYFMTTQRCVSCKKIEAYTKEAVERSFAADLKKGSIAWRMVNVDAPENVHFVKDYRLYTKSVVLVKIRNGKQVEWKNLDKVWTLLGDKAAFQRYITGEVKKFAGKS